MTFDREKSLTQLQVGAGNRTAEEKKPISIMDVLTTLLLYESQ